MKTLSQFNREKRNEYRAANDTSPRPNDIECPACGAELMDSNPTITLASNPPKKTVHCPKCSFQGYRSA